VSIYKVTQQQNKQNCPEINKLKIGHFKNGHLHLHHQIFKRKFHTPQMISKPFDDDVSVELPETSSETLTYKKVGGKDC